MDELLKEFPTLRRAIDLRLFDIHRYWGPSKDEDEYSKEYERLLTRLNPQVVRQIERVAESSMNKLFLSLIYGTAEDFRSNEMQRSGSFASDLCCLHIPPPERYTPLVMLLESDSFCYSPGHTLACPPVVREAAGELPCSGADLLMGFVSNAHRGLRDSAPLPSHSVITYLWLIHFGTARTLSMLRSLYEYGWLPWDSTFSRLCLMIFYVQIHIKDADIRHLTFESFVDLRLRNIDTTETLDKLLELCDNAFESIVGRVKETSKKAHSLAAWWRSLLCCDAEFLWWHSLISDRRQNEALPKTVLEELNRYYRGFEEWKGITIESRDLFLLGLLSEHSLSAGLLPKRTSKSYHHRLTLPLVLSEEVRNALASVELQDRPIKAAELYLEWISQAPRELRLGPSETREELAAKLPLYADIINSGG